MHIHFNRNSGRAACARKMLLRSAAVVAACVLPHHAWALVKCVDGEGKVTFQDVMCNNQSASVAVLQRFGQMTTEPAPVRTKPQPTTASKLPPERMAASSTR